MPCNTLDILTMLHQDTHAIEIAIWFDCDKVQRQSLTGKTGFLPSHIQTVLSLLQLASKVPVLEYPTLLHSVSCPSSKHTHSQSPDPSALSGSPASCSHTPMFESKDAVASDLPDGDHARPRTVLVCPVGIVVTWENFGEEPSVGRM